MFLLIIDASIKSKSFVFTVFAVGNFKQTKDRRNMQHYSFVCLVIIDVSNESKSFFFTVFAVGNIKQRRSNVSHRSVGVVEFVPDDGGDSLEGFL